MQLLVVDYYYDVTFTEISDRFIKQRHAYNDFRT